MGEGLHRLLVQKGEDLHLDLVGVVVLDHVLQAARPRQIDIDHGAHLGGHVGHHQNLIGKEDRLVNIRGDEECGAARLLIKVRIILLHQLLGHGIEPAKRLVEDHNPWLVDHCAGELRSPLHPA